MARLLTGREAASALTEELKGRTASLARQGVTPKLVILRCGENEADGAYLRGALKRGALCGMVANLTTGKKAYLAVESDIQQLLSTTNALQEKLLDQVAADAEGFLPLAAVYALPKDAPDRAAKLVQASETACAVPLRIMELCVDALAAAGRLADIGSRLAVSDAGCAAAILGGALRAASLNVLVNTKAMGAAGAPLTERCLALLARGEAASDAVFKQVKDRLL